MVVSAAEVFVGLSTSQRLVWYLPELAIQGRLESLVVPYSVGKRRTCSRTRWGRRSDNRKWANNGVHSTRRCPLAYERRFRAKGIQKTIWMMLNLSSLSLVWTLSIIWKWFQFELTLVSGPHELWFGSYFVKTRKCTCVCKAVLVWHKILFWTDHNCAQRKSLLHFLLAMYGQFYLHISRVSNILFQFTFHLAWNLGAQKGNSLITKENSCQFI